MIRAAHFSKNGKCAFYYAVAFANVSDADLKNNLKGLRRKLADEYGWKALYIFTNKTLGEWIEEKPTTLDGLWNISGIGDKNSGINCLSDRDANWKNTESSYK